MSDDEYTKLPESEIEVRDVTADYAETIKNLLVSDPFIPKLRFPRLRFPALEGLGYCAEDYKAIAKMIAPDRIEIYETRNDELFNAKYASYGDMNFYVLTPKITVAPSLSVRILVHETTHAIQDWKKWRESSLDREVDAHFAEALYLVKSKKAHEAKSDMGMTYFMIAAEEYDNDPKYLASNGFRKIREKMRTEIFQHYQFMSSLLVSNFDAEEFGKKFRKRQRLDGIPQK